MNDLALKNEQQVETIARGQTSDQLSAINEYVLPEDYKWNENPIDIKSFFTYEDYIYLLQEGQKAFEEYKENIKKSSIYSRWGRLFKKNFNLGYLNIFPCFASDNDVYDEVHFSFDCFIKLNFRDVKYSISDILNKGYDFLLSEIKRLIRFYDFSGDLSIVPEGASITFANGLIYIDENIHQVKDGFISICVGLHGLSTYDEKNILAYGCKDFYDFAEKRFGFGRTSVKNFLAIYDKFIDGATVKPAFKDYSYSQLTELVSVPSWKLADFSADMTVKEIREKKKEMSKPAEKSEAESTENDSVHADTVKTYERKLDESSVLKTILKMPNPYFISDKEKQSARYDAYEKALNDVLEVLNRRLGCTREFRGEEWNSLF